MEKVLKWSDRLAVLIGVGKAVHFLHTGVIPPSSCNRLKTNNVLLDEHGIGKLSDYGMSILREEVDKTEVKSLHIIMFSVVSIMSNMVCAIFVGKERFLQVLVSIFFLPFVLLQKTKIRLNENCSYCRHMNKLEDDVYNFGFILLESLVGPIIRGKEEAFLLNEMVHTNNTMHFINSF